MEDSKTKLQKIRAELRLKSLANFKKITHVDIPEIPKERTKFPNSINDWWYAIELNDMDSTACIYELDSKGVFPPHFHNTCSEQIIPLTPGAKMEVVTDNYEKIVEFPDSIYFKAKEPHALINLTNKPVLIMVIWSPKMIGWDATFLDNNTTIDK